MRQSEEDRHYKKKKKFSFNSALSLCLYDSLNPTFQCSCFFFLHVCKKKKGKHSITTSL